MEIPVTPYVGVWIETLLKITGISGNVVTPYVGVWIETADKRDQDQLPYVTPYVGVWIETALVSAQNRKRMSLLMWECGLKQIQQPSRMFLSMSLLMWECGLKHSRLTPIPRSWCHSLCGSVD